MRVETQRGNIFSYHARILERSAKEKLHGQELEGRFYVAFEGSGVTVFAKSQMYEMVANTA